MSVVFTTLVIEIGMRGIGAVYRMRVHENTQIRGVPTDLILCVGDSHTAGIGAPAGKDYPSQLQAILNQRGNERVYQVINLGHSGFNSSQAANEAVRYLTHRTVDIPVTIIFNAGRNNSHNLTDARIVPEQLRTQGVKRQVDYLFAKSRAFRFGQITMSRLEHLLDGSKSDHWLEFSINPFRKEEINFLSDWLQKDLEYVETTAHATNSKLVLLNYWTPVTVWVEQAFTEFSRKNRDVLFVDVKHFRRSPMEFPIFYSKLVSDDGHPNEFGYAVISEFIDRDMAARYHSDESASKNSMNKEALRGVAPGPS